MLEHPGVEAGDFADLPAREGHHKQARGAEHVRGGVGAVRGERRLPVRPRLHDAEGRPRADGGSAVTTNGLLHDEVLAAFGRTGADR